MRHRMTFGYTKYRPALYPAFTIHLKLPIYILKTKGVDTMSDVTQLKAPIEEFQPDPGCMASS